MDAPMLKIWGRDGRMCQGFAEEVDDGSWIVYLPANVQKEDIVIAHKRMAGLRYRFAELTMEDKIGW